MNPAPALRLRALDATEAQILASILAYLRRDRRVAWVERFNVGAARVAQADGRERFVRFAFRGCSDLLGQLTDGRLLAIEVKTRVGRVRPEQEAFIARVRDGQGVGLIARSVDDVVAAINAACG